MILQLRIGNWKFTFTCAQVTDVIGVNSTLPDGNHILMWDFDNCPLDYVRRELTYIMQLHKLPPIYILNSGKPDHYMAYCFKRLPWQKAFGIVASTEGVDWNFIKYAAVRGHFTLRVSPKNGRKIKLEEVIPSPIPEDASVRELRSWVKYETLTREGDMRKWSLQISKNGCVAKTFQ